MAAKKLKQGSLPSLTNQISFNFIDVAPFIRKRVELREWIINCIARQKRETGNLSFNFCSDGYLLKLNKQYLNHNEYTDIITFDFTEGILVSGDIYISKDRVKENARKLSIPFHVEQKRVIIHGVLHLCGYKDKTTKDKALMRKKEDDCLSLLS